MIAGCEECRDLWRVYGLATTAHIRLQSKLRIAALEDDLDEIAALTPQLEAAEKARADQREAIRRHEQTAHANAVTA
jgi:hypothetical protein